MTILEFIKSDDYAARISWDDKWLYYNKYINMFVVCQHPYKARKTKILVETGNEEIAVSYLIGDK